MPAPSLHQHARVPNTASPDRPLQHSSVAAAFHCARERYAEYGVDVDAALAILKNTPISLHCWQGDDVCGFESLDAALGGGIAVTGNYPGRARNAEELRSDLDQALSLIPSRHRLNLHASYGEFGGQPVDRDAIEPAHFAGWIEWASERGVGIDFNPTCFSHPKAADGFTLSHPDPAIQDFWIEHCRRARNIGSVIGQALGSPCVTNVWVPDGFKDTPADRLAVRERLAASLDRVFAETLPAEHVLDALEPKLFGIGSESFTAGSAEFCFGYCITRKKLLCLDAGHFHPTETISDKISSVLLYLPRILLHVSRGVRWDSDHVVTLNDDLLAITREIVATGGLNRIHIGLDYFDASINRVAAWVIGTRNVQKALLIALLEPPAIRQAENEGDYTARLALQEEAKMLPAAAVWDHFCESENVPVGSDWLSAIRTYEATITDKRA